MKKVIIIAIIFIGLFIAALFTLNEVRKTFEPRNEVTTEKNNDKDIIGTIDLRGDEDEDTDSELSIEENTNDASDILDNMQSDITIDTNDNTEEVKNIEENTEGIEENTGGIEENTGGTNNNTEVTENRDVEMQLEPVENKQTSTEVETIPEDDKEIKVKYEIYDLYKDRGHLVGESEHLVKKSELVKGWGPTYPEVSVKPGYEIGDWCYTEVVDGETKIYYISVTEYNRVKKQIDAGVEEVTYYVTINSKKYDKTTIIFNSTENIKLHLEAVGEDTSSNETDKNATSDTLTYITNTNKVYVPTITHYKDNIPYCWVDAVTGNVVYSYDTGWADDRKMTYEDADGNRVYEWNLVSIKENTELSEIKFNSGLNGDIVSKSGKNIDSYTLLKELNHYKDIEFPEIEAIEGKEFIGWQNDIDGTPLKAEDGLSIANDNGRYSFTAVYIDK